MDNTASKYFCPRLVDYIAIVGARKYNGDHSNATSASSMCGESYVNQTTSSNPAAAAAVSSSSSSSSTSSYSVQMPELLRRYPPEDHKDFSLPPDVVFFCQPEGCFFLKSKRSAVREINTFVFTLMEKDTSRIRYGVVLNFYRPIERKKLNTGSDCHSSRCMSNRPSPVPRVSTTGDTLSSVKHSTVSSSDTELNSNAFVTTTTSEFSTHDTVSPLIRKKKQSNISCLTSLCLLSHHPFFSTFRECLFVLKRLIDVCSERNFNYKSSTMHHSKKDWVWSLLTSPIPETLSPSIIALNDVKEIETWILRLLSVPVPVPGKTKIELQILPEELRSPFILALPDHTRLSLVDFPLHLPLELLGVDSCLKILSLILLEQKILMQSRDYNVLSMSVMAFVTMIYPLEYMFPVIPLLPSCMASAEQLLLAPTPYIIGVPASFVNFKRNFRLPDDVWLIDLDANKIVKPIAVEDILPFPEPDGSTLQNHLKQALASMSMNPQPLKNLDSLPLQSIPAPIPPKPASTGFNPFIYGNDIDSVDIATRVAIIRFLNSSSLLANFTEHTRTIRLYPRPVVAFQVNSFLQSRPKASPFLTKLVRTQAVEFLAEWSLSPTNVAFLRVQTGVFDPAIIGDKAKWFSNQLKCIPMKIWNEGTAVIATNSYSYVTISPSKKLNSSDDSDESDQDVSSGSSYSSLSDYVNEMVRSELSDFLSSSTDPVEAASAHVISNVRSIFHPPDTLLLNVQEDQQQKQNISHDESKVDTMMSNSNVTSKCIDKDSSSIIDATIESGKLSSPIDTSSSTTSTQSTPDSSSFNDDEEERLFPTSPDTGSGSGTGTAIGSEAATITPGEIITAQHAPSIRSSTSSRSSHKTATSSSSPRNTSSSITSVKRLMSNTISASTDTKETRPLSAEPSESIEKTTVAGSGRSSPTLSRTMSISSVFSRAGSLAAVGHSSSGDSASSFLDRFTSEAKEVAREAKAAAAEASKAAIEATKKDQRAQKLIQNIQSNLEPMKTSAKELWRLSQEGSSDIAPSLSGVSNAGNSNSSTSNPFNDSSASIISSVSNDFNGLADKTSSMFTGLFATKAANIAEKMKEKAQPFTTQLQQSRMSRKGLVEKTSLIRHTTNQRKGSFSFITDRASNIDQSRSNHNENQQFLKEVVDTVLDGEGVGWLKLGRVRRLMEDENYRTLVVTRLHKNLETKVGPDDHIEDICVTKAVWKGMLKLLNAIVYGLEQSYTSNGIGGMASAIIALEIAHTHYWARDLSDISGGKSGATGPGGLGGPSAGDSSVASTASVSQVTSPFGSGDNLHKLPRDESSGDLKASPTNKLDNLSECTTVDTGVSKTEIWVSQSSEFDSNRRSSSEAASQVNRKESTDKPLSDSASGGDIAITGCRSSDPDALNTNASYFSVARLSQHSCRSTYSDSELEALQGRQTRTASVWSKSSVSTGYRYTAGNLIGSAGYPVDAPRTYLFQGMIGKERSQLWDHMQFWEDVYLDAVSHEREVVGMDQGPGEMMERYKLLSDVDRRRLEAEEDRLLSTLLYNLTAFMVMTGIDRSEIKRKVRRLLGKCHIGLVYSAEINGLLDQLENLHGNDIDLKPLTSRQMHRQTFTLHLGTDTMGEMVFMEVRDDGLILRSVNGTIIERWWYERLVNMTYSPKNKILCLWRRSGGQTQLHKYYTKKCKELYYCIKEAMGRAASRGAGAMPGTELGGEFPVQDMKTGEGGLLQVCMEGVGLLFANSKFFVRLENIRKCFTQKGGIFVLEEFNPKTRQVIQRRYNSQLADQICYAVLCVFSYIAAGQEQTKKNATTHSKAIGPSKLASCSQPSTSDQMG